MTRWIILSALLFAFTMGYSISNEEVRALIDKKTATVGDAMVLVGSIDKADFDKNDIKAKNNSRLAALKLDTALNAGDLAVILIENKKAAGGLFYSVTGFGKYATESLVNQGIYPKVYSWNREISGKELIETVALAKEKSGK
jgi:hypothetical protein